MAITTMDGLIAGLNPPVFAGKSYSGVSIPNAWKTNIHQGGFPAQASATSTGASGENQTFSTTPKGYYPYKNPVSGNTHVARLEYYTATASGSVGASTLLVDRLWRFGSSAGTGAPLDRTLTTAQAISTFTLPARDENGSTNGEGVIPVLEVQTTMGTGVPTVTISYTNSAGTAGRSGSLITPVTASSAAGVVYPIGLQAGDTGVRSIQSITFSATWGTAGVLFLSLIRPIAMLSCDTPNYLLGVPMINDGLQLGFPRVYDDSCLCFFQIANSSAFTPVGQTGQLQLTQG